MILDSLLQLIFPKICPVCELNRVGTDILCPKCCSKIVGLPLILHQKIVEEVQATEDSPLMVAFLFNSTLRKILHRLKYDGFQTLGYKMGRLMAEKMRQNNWVGFDFIIPVPLHKRKMKERGYNQSEILARGMSSVLNIPVLTDCLYRNTYTRSQTQFNKTQRRENVHRAFRVKHSHLISEKNILLLDDVVTTGATLNECARELKKSSDCAVYKCAVATPLF